MWCSLFLRSNISSRGKRMKIQFLNSSKSFSNSRAILSLLAVIVLLPSSAFGARAQVTTADVRGTLMDEQGAAIAGADVTITSSNPAYTHAWTSESDGQYTFTNLPLGTYSVHVTHACVKAETQTSMVLHVN